MYAEEESTAAYSNHVAGRARCSNRDYFASLAMTEPELIEKLQTFIGLGLVKVDKRPKPAPMNL